MSPNPVTMYILVLIVAFWCAAPALSTNTFIVGSNQGWSPTVNYTAWAGQYRFYMGDLLVFMYQAGQADVLQVNKTSYDGCISDNQISSMSQGSSFSFELNHTGWFFFICSRGQCHKGMKLTVEAQALPPSPPSAASDPRRWNLPHAIATAAAIFGAGLL